MSMKTAVATDHDGRPVRFLSFTITLSVTGLFTGMWTPPCDTKIWLGAFSWATTQVDPRVGLVSSKP